MDWKEILKQIYDMIGTPTIISILGALAYVGTKFLNQIKTIMSAKAELLTISSENEIRQQVFDILDSTVEAAVASNMQLADKLKLRNNGKLDPNDVTQLQESAKRLTEHALPASLLKEDSSTLAIIGGKEKINSMISTLIEKHVYEYNAEKDK